MSVPGPGAVFLAVLRRDLLLVARRRSEWANPLLFFVIAVSLFPLGVGPEAGTLRDIAPGVIWVAALLAAMLALDGLFRADYEDGSLEQLLLSPQPLTVIVLAKVTAHWLATAGPLIVLAPVLGVAMHLPAQALPVLVLTLLLGTPVLSLLGAIGAALIVSVRRGGVLLALLILPLCIPVLIFSANAVQAAAVGLPVEAQLSLLGALLLLALSVAPLAAAGALRIGAGG